MVVCLAASARLGFGLACVVEQVGGRAGVGHRARCLVSGWCGSQHSSALRPSKSSRISSVSVRICSISSSEIERASPPFWSVTADIRAGLSWRSFEFFCLVTPLYSRACGNHVDKKSFSTLKPIDDEVRSHEGESRLNQGYCASTSFIHKQAQKKAALGRGGSDGVTMQGILGHHSEYSNNAVNIH